MPDELAVQFTVPLLLKVLGANWKIGEFGNARFAVAPEETLKVLTVSAPPPSVVVPPERNVKAFVPPRLPPERLSEALLSGALRLKAPPEIARLPPVSV